MPAGSSPARPGAWGSTSRDKQALSSPSGATARRSVAWFGSGHGGSPPERSATLAVQSKRFRALKQKAPKDPLPLADAIKELKAFGTTKFNQTVEVSTNLGIDPRQSDQN